MPLESGKYLAVLAQKWPQYFSEPHLLMLAMLPDG